MFIDSKGKLFGKVSIIDLVVLVVIVGLCGALAVRTFGGDTPQIVSANHPFYTTFVFERVRTFSVDAVAEGDVVYEQFEKVIGTVVKVETTPAKDIMKRDDGTAVNATIDDRYNLYVTVACNGTVNDAGYFSGGSKQFSVGSEFKLQTNTLLAGAKIAKLSQTLE